MNQSNTTNMPRSNALAEASPSSVQELFTRDPEGLADNDLDVIILYMRDLRTRIEASGAIAARTRGKKEPAPKISFEDFFDGNTT